MNVEPLESTFITSLAHNFRNFWTKFGKSGYSAMHGLSRPLLTASKRAEKRSKIGGLLQLTTAFKG